MTIDLSATTLCLEQAKSLDTLSTAIKSGYKQLVIVSGNKCSIGLAANRTLRMTITPELVAELNLTMGGVIDTLVQALIDKARVSMVVPIPLSTPTPSTTTLTPMPVAITSTPSTIPAITPIPVAVVPKSITKPVLTVR